MDIRAEMPVLARHEGEWEGTYTSIDNDGNILDSHRCHLVHSFPQDGEVPYMQINTYTWDDGRQEVSEYPAAYRDGKILFDNERIKGHAWDADPRTVILTWSYRDAPEKYLYEIIHISDDGQHRTRTWHWYDDGEVFKRTLIKERRVT